MLRQVSKEILSVICLSDDKTVEQMKAKGGDMRFPDVQEHKYNLAFVGAGIAIALIIIGVAGSLLSTIDRQLHEDAKLQVEGLTEQAAENAAGRIKLTENIIQSFAVQTDDIESICQSMQELKMSCGFAEVAFFDKEGNSHCTEGDAFSSDDISSTAIAGRVEDVTYRVPDTSLGGEYLFQAEKPLTVNGEEIGTLYINIPLTTVIDEGHFSIYDGQGHFILFQEETGMVLISSSEESQWIPDTGDSLYDFLDAAQHGKALGEGGVSEETRNVSRLKSSVEEGESDLITATIDGEAFYICVMPLELGNFYMCSIIPENNVRSEASSIDVTFIIVFGIIILSLFAVLAMFSFLYRKRMGEKDLEMKTHLYGALSDSLDMAVNMYSPEDEAVTPIVAKSREIIGYSMSEIMGNRRVADRIDLSESGRDILDRLRAGEIASFERGEFSFKGRQIGEPRWVSYAVTPFYYENKRQLLVVFQDSTNAKNLELSMKDAMVAAETANHAKSDFLSRMSHEIRTPMNAIIGMTQIAQKHLDDPEKIAASLDKINLASDQLLGLINDVLDISKIESGKMMLAHETFKLGELVENVNLVITAQCDQKGQSFSIEQESIIEERFYGDHLRLQQVLINLLSNSVKYTPYQGTISLKVSQRACSVANYVETTFIVSDSGIGMSGEYLKRLFEPFSMEERSRSQGTGLGMSIVKNILTMMNGDIQVESVLDRGTTFTVVVNLECIRKVEVNIDESIEGSDDFKNSLIRAGQNFFVNLGGSSVTDPQSPSSEGEGDLSDEAMQVGGSPEQKTKQAGSLTNVRVLLAEDNELNAEIAKELLSDAGLVVVWAHDGEEVCEMFEQSEPGFYDLILMDIQMPKQTGYEATAYIRGLKRDDAQSIPIIAMSANAFMEDVQASLRSGMNDHLSKPIDIRLVLDSIKRHVR